MKRILVPVDFSARSINGLHLAAEIAKRSKAKLTLLHVMVDPYIFLSAPNSYLTPVTESAVQLNYLNNLEKSSNETLKKLAKKPFLKAVNPRLATVTGGSIYREILNYAEEKKHDMIVMGTNGAKSFGQIFLGTNAERILRFTSIPVLVVGQKIKSPVIRNIVFASKFNESARQVFPYVYKFAKLFKSKIYLLRINTGEMHQLKVSWNFNVNMILHENFGFQSLVRTCDSQETSQYLTHCIKFSVYMYVYL